MEKETSLNGDDFKKVLDFHIGMNPALQITKNSINKGIINCLNNKQKYFTSPSDELFNKVKSTLSTVRRRILELSKKREYILHHYMTAIKSLDYSLWQSIFSIYNDTLIGKKLGDTLIDEDVLDGWRAKYFLETLETQKKQTKNETDTFNQTEEISQNFLSTHSKSNFYTVTNAVQKVLLIVLVGAGMYFTGGGVNKQKKTDTILHKHTVKITDSKTYIPFTDIKHLDYDSLTLRPLSKEGDYILHHTEKLFPGISDSLQEGLSMKDYQKLQLFVSGFNFGKFSNVIYQVIETNMKNWQEYSKNTEHISQKELLTQCLFDDIFFYTLPPEIRGLHDNKGRDNINIILNTAIEDKDEFLEVITHEVFHSFFDKLDGYVASEGKTHLLTIKNIRKYYKKDVFMPNHPYTPFITYCRVIDKAYSMDKNMKQYLPYLNIMKSKTGVQWEKGNDLSVLLATIGHDNPNFCLPPQWQVFIGGGYQIVKGFVDQDSDLSPNMKTYLSLLLEKYKNTDLFQHDGDSIQKKADYLQKRYSTNKNNSEYNHISPSLPFFDDGTKVNNNKLTEKDSEYDNKESTQEDYDTNRDWSLEAIDDFLPWMYMTIMLTLLLWSKSIKREVEIPQNLYKAYEFTSNYIKKTTHNKALPLLESFKKALVLENDDIGEFTLGEYREQWFLDEINGKNTSSLGLVRLAFIFANLSPIFSFLIFEEGGNGMKSLISTSAMLFYMYQRHKTTFKDKSFAIGNGLEKQLKKRLDIISEHYDDKGIVGFYDKLYEMLPESQKGHKSPKIRPMFKETPKKIFKKFGEDVDLYNKTLDNFTTLGSDDYKKNVMHTEYFSNVDLLKELKGKLNLDTPSCSEPINNKKIGIFFFEIEPIGSQGQKPEGEQKILKNLYKLHYALQNLNFETYLGRYHARIYLTLRNQSIKSRTITAITDIREVFKEMQDIYMKYIHLEPYFEIPGCVPNALRKKAKDEAKDYGYCYTSCTALNDAAEYLQEEVDNRNTTVNTKKITIDNWKDHYFKNRII